MRWIFAPLVLLSLLLAAGCSKRVARETPAARNGESADALRSLGYVGGNGAKAQAVAAPSAAAPASPAPESAEPAAAAASNPAAMAVRKLIRRVELQLTVRDTDATARAAQKLADRLHGYVEGVDAQRSGDLMYYTLTLRIPSAGLDEALATLKQGADRIDHETQAVEDVTSQFVDLTARLKTLGGTEAELRALLAESRSRNRKVDEIMSVYRELTEIRSQIEQIEGQVRTFERLSSLSTLKLTLVPTESAKPVAEPGWHPLDSVRSAFRSLVSALRGGIDVLIFVLIVILPIVLVGVLVLKGLFWLWRRLRRLLRGRQNG